MHPHWKEHPEINTGGGRVPGGEEERGVHTPKCQAFRLHVFPCVTKDGVR